MTTYRNNPRAGFSLIEAMIVTAISAVVGGCIVSLLVGQMTFSATHNRNMINEENLRDTLNFMCDEIAATGNNCAEPYVKQAEAAHIRFVGDMNGDAVWDQAEYYLENGALKRRLRTSDDGGANWTVISTDTLIDGVSSLEFTYYRPGNETTTNADEVTSIVIRIVLDPNSNVTALTRSRVAGREMTSRVTLRNRQF